MKIFMVFGVFIFLAFQPVNCQIAKQQKGENSVQASDKEWRPGNYRGLHVGKSTTVDMIRVLGKPTWSGKPYTSQEVWYEYPKAGEFQSKVTVIASKRSKIILSIDLYPENLTKKQAVDYFGPDYLMTRYDFDECEDYGESGAMYESKTGSITFIEYRNRGIAIGLDADDNVNEINFVKGPIGTTNAKCTPKRESGTI